MFLWKFICHTFFAFITHPSSFISYGHNYRFKCIQTVIHQTLRDKAPPKRSTFFLPFLVQRLFFEWQSKNTRRKKTKWTFTERNLNVFECLILEENNELNAIQETEPIWHGENRRAFRGYMSSDLISQTIWVNNLQLNCYRVGLRNPIAYFYRSKKCSLWCCCFRHNELHLYDHGIGVLKCAEVKLKFCWTKEKTICNAKKKKLSKTCCGLSGSSMKVFPSKSDFLCARMPQFRQTYFSSGFRTFWLCHTCCVRDEKIKKNGNVQRLIW